MNVAKNLERAAFYFPNRPVTVEDSKETTYKQLNERADRVAAKLVAEGLAEHDGPTWTLPGRSS